MEKFKKLLKDKNTVTILGVLMCLAILAIGYKVQINKVTKFVEVYYANQTIQPKTLITEDMISETKVPESFIEGNYFKDYNDIVGKYSNYNTMIVSGSLFYTELLVEESSLPDSVLYNANEGERVVSFPVDTASTYGNSIMPGNIVDIYVKLYNTKGKVIYGEFFENIEILGVKDSAGRNVFENTEETREPSFVYFSLPEAKYLLFSSINSTTIKEAYGLELILVPNTLTFDTEDPTASEVSSSYLYRFVLNEIQKIDNQEKLYNELLNEIEQKELEEKQKENDKNNNTDNNSTNNNTDNNTSNNPFFKIPE